MTLKSILLIWLPLAFANLFMSLEMPIASAIISRQPDIITNLAAFQFGFGLVLLFEGPIILLLSTSAALVKDRDTYEAVKHFSCIISCSLSLILGILFLSGIFLDYLAPLLHLSHELAQKIDKVCSIMFCAPFVVGMRRFYQGCLVATAKTKYVAFSTFFRMLAMCFIGFSLAYFSGLAGSEAAAFALVSGMTVDFLLVRTATKRHFHIIESFPKQESLNFAKIFHFYHPLALNGLLNLSQAFILGIFLSQAILPKESLALWQVLMGISLVLFAFPFSYQETILSALRKGIKEAPLRSIGSTAALVIIVLFVVTLSSPLYSYWLGTYLKFDVWLQELAYPAFWLSTVTLGLVFLSNTEKSFLIYQKKTKIVGLASVVDLVTMLLGMFILSQYMIGLYAAAITALLARTMSLLVMKFGTA